MNELTTDVAIIGSGGAGLFAALRAAAHPARLDVTVVVKGLFGKSGCTRMVQGGYNAALQAEDSPEIHLRDTIVGGGYLNDQHLAKTLTDDAPALVEEMEQVLGCRFDRAPGGDYDFKPFGGMTLDRTVHRRDLTGIEIVSRLADHVMTHPGVRILEEHRALDLLLSDDGARVRGLVALDIRTGEFLVIRARAVLLATGGGARMYRYSSPSMEKSGDGVAMAFRAGLQLMDMEMLQFHPTGLLAGDSVLTGSVVEEGLRGAGGHLLNVAGERFMEAHDPERMERSTRDIVSQAIYLEVMESRGSPQGGVFLDVSHLGAQQVRTEFPGMVDRASLAGRDLTSEAIEVVPTSHFHMGGVRIGAEGRTPIEGLFVAGEDAGGVHGCNRLGGNGVAESTVFGARAGEQMARFAASAPPVGTPVGQAGSICRRAEALMGDPAGTENPHRMRKSLEEAMWMGAGVVRHRQGLERTVATLLELSERLQTVRPSGGRRYNLGWNEAMDLENLMLVAASLCHSALHRTESRGAHHRSDYPHGDDRRWLRNVIVSPDTSGGMSVSSVPVEFPFLAPSEL
ncbi:MAG: FAD-binding protein [bacterium]|nr:FAD-binding protein [bacterium]MDE0438802.1 FAD-binding protein [bacterium]